MLFVKFAKVFGAQPSKAQKMQYQHYDNYQGGKFNNLMPQFTVIETPNFIENSIEPKATRQPDFDIPFVKLTTDDLTIKPKHARFTWFGHSTFLLEIDGKNIMIDPMLSAVPSPVQGIGRKRYSKGLPLTADELPELDGVLITHDHYDHLDYWSIKKIKAKVKTFYVPLGLSAHLLAWGVNKAQIKELNWYEDAYLDTIRLTLTPSHHYSGRSLTDRFQSLWGGWVIKGAQDNIYLSGDGGYGSHFKEIGEKYGPFDFAMIECGQYSRYWRQNHLFPEQSALVAAEVQARLVMPIHWGAFTLAMHSWTAPVERFIQRINELAIPVTTPKIGEQFVLDPALEKPKAAWWKKP
ncbi:MBL fold metallo-hydrolase [Aureispira anguillae]|uniref:MBL fold metallo-hydrolase n=1 Tax=Aureispira anguillae TaxID=2864201 RepID=A0A915YB77_9BACT|nr:MBL fold metallo-hydrolase [Aureispira anguillae]BDS09875.1 MBL fold metallo-hydrolase [Aureispira anguillae]